MGVALVNENQPLSPYPNIAGQTAFAWADGDSTDFNGDLATLNSSACWRQYTRGFASNGTAVVTHRYTLGSTVGDGIIVMNANPVASWNTILMGFAWGDLLDVPGTPPGNRRADLRRRS